MSYGLEFNNEAGEPTLSTEGLAYACIFSGEVNKGFILNDLAPGDIIAHTSVGDYYGGIGKFPRDQYISRWWALDKSRLIVFRPFHAVPKKINYGMELVDSDGETTYSTGYHLLKLATPSTTYHALIQSTAQIYMIFFNIPDIEIPWQFYAYAEWVKPSGLEGVHNFDYNDSQHWNPKVTDSRRFMPPFPAIPAGNNEPIAYTDIMWGDVESIKIDVSDIPYNYSEGLVSITPTN